ncbi:transcriptional regulator, MarR family [Alicyclobacillus hesperidum URH17-3-68]|uniref:HTH-type transcriptional regulator YsmB n=1 Tax=Alicyclobacillus hesperidum TaxID=89784 RepID=A0AA37X454_9BACL|nr:transcriptional regulator, MarR family [Alicyclobacillus hesperidum URH17-3-68]GLG00900.1 putative HTH-type transcriptional regulator YsmB [Alicyclobacillus hesperidum subsp. aegles]GLV13822.1 putative HTH-type transcriptional regulator YsmB [Alicyclobacillus hesperidum]
MVEFNEYVEEIEKSLRLVAAAVRRKGRVLLREHDITSPQFDALIALNNEGELTIGELSSKLYLAYSTTTDLVDRLEKAGYVCRQRDLVDRRVVRVQLRPPGAQIIEEVLRARRAYLHTILSHVDVSTRKTILEALELLLTNMANQ